MATIRRRATGTEIRLRAGSIFGRSSRADVRLIGDASSAEHASIHWDGNDWFLRDLTSRNGTKINGVPLTTREWRLADSDVIVFGDPSEVWIWVDGAPPQAQATRDDGVVVEAVNGLLLLPDDHQPRASVYAREEGWEMDLDGVARPVEDGERVRCGEWTFQLSLPSLNPATHRTLTVTESRQVAHARAVFRVSSHGEHVELTLQLPGDSRHLGSRVFNHLLLLLAEARRSDTEAAIAREEAGWIYTDEAADRLKITPEKVNVDVHRARRVVAATGLFANSEDLIERRRGCGQIRLGISDIVVQRNVAQGPPTGSPGPPESAR